MSVIIPSRRHLITRTKMPLLMPGASVNRGHPLAQELVSWWRVNQVGYGTNTWYDLMGLNPSTLTNMGVHNQTSGWSGSTRADGAGEILFDGTDDYGLNSNISRSTGELSVAAWIYPTATTDFRGIYRNGNTNLNTNFNLYLANSAGTPRLRVFWANAIRATSTRVVTANTWTHVAAVRSGSAGAWTVSFYFNGVLDSSTSGIATNPVAGTWPEWLGRSSFTTEYWSGSLDDILLAERAWNGAEVAALYLSSLTGHYELLIPSRTRYYIFTPSAAGSIITCEPSRAQYQAQTPRITVGVVATPARSQYQTLAQQLTRSLAANPSQAQYQAQVIQITRGILETPSRAQYQAQTPIAAAGGALIQVTPGRSQYQAQVPRITLGVVATPSRALYQASTPVAAAANMLVSATAGQAQYQAQTPNLGRTAVCTPSRSQYQAQTPRITLGVTEQPSRAQYQATTPVINGATTVVVTQGQAQYQAQTPVTHRPVAGTPARSQYQAGVPNITMTVVVQPSRSQMQAGTPVLGRTIIVSQGQGQYQAVTPLTGRTALVTPSQSQYRAQTPIAGMDTMGEVNVTPSRAQYQATTPIAAIETPAVYYSKQADGVGLAIQTVHPAVDGGGIQTLHPPVCLRL